MPEHDPKLREHIETLQTLLGAHLVAVYRFDSEFAGGPSGVHARLLVLIDRVEPSVLLSLSEATADIQAENYDVVIDTVADLLASTDTFPIFALNLSQTRRLLAGPDVLLTLALDPDDLRLGIEHRLRTLHRQLLRALLTPNYARRLGADLRRFARTAKHLLIGLLELGRHTPPATHHTRDVLEAAIQAGFITQADLPVWQRLRNFTTFTEAHDLRALTADVLAALTRLIRVVDAL